MMTKARWLCAGVALGAGTLLATELALYRRAVLRLVDHLG